MSTEAWMFWGLIFGSIGFGFFLYGKKQRNPVSLLCGIALMVYPYFISSSWAMIVIGAVLIAIPYFVRL